MNSTSKAFTWPSHTRATTCSTPKQAALHQDTHLKVLRLLQANPRMSQRGLAAALGVSLGKTNFCLKELLVKGLLKVQNFQNSKRKLAYACLLTPAKTALTGRFLARKMAEYELLKAVKWTRIQDNSLSWTLFKEAGKA